MQLPHTQCMLRCAPVVVNAVNHGSSYGCNRSFDRMHAQRLARPQATSLHDSIDSWWNDKLVQEATHWEMFKLRQNSSLRKLQVRPSNHAFLALLKLECYLVCYRTALYKTDVWGDLNRQQKCQTWHVGGGGGDGGRWRRGGGGGGVEMQAALLQSGDCMWLGGSSAKCVSP